MILECKDGSFAVVDVALVIAVGELRPDITQVALLDRLTAQRAERLRAGCSAVHQDESHVASPQANNTMCAGPLIARLKFEA